ncbi:heme biosynthesis protein HemY [Halodurantibacterium flavum]|uniref:Heme biosynthesis protein HemY n=1 Tax=Halodurantibacterium flavum TaxID=1382802 RepID=A0ABW4SBU3_9RHOB
MLWSLVKIVLFIALVAGLGYGASVLTETQDGLRIAVANTEITLGPLQAVILALLLMLALWVLLRLVGLLVATLRFLNGDETALSRYFDRSRERKGFEALSDGLIALAGGEGRAALRKAERAERYLGRPELTQLVTAQAAEMIGDSRRAEEAYKNLLKDDRTRFVAIRGIVKQRLAQGDTATALQLARKAFALKPRHLETQDLLLKLQAEQGDWKGARETLGAKAKAGALPKDVYRRRDAVLALQEAREVFAEGNSIEAREAAIAANKLSPDLIPAATMTARSFIAEGNKKYAARVLRKAWEARPHPDLAAAFAEIEPEETPAARLKRFSTLTALRPEHEETRLLLAELNIAAEDFPAARRAVGRLVETHPTARVLTIMAAIERGEGAEDAIVRGWLTKALTAPRGPQWTCDSCHNIYAQWVPICENCGGFDTLNWSEPPEGAGPSATQTEMLPIIVGAPAARPAADIEGEAVAPPDAPPSTAPDAQEAPGPEERKVAN